MAWARRSESGPIAARKVDLRKPDRSLPDRGIRSSLERCSGWIRCISFETRCWWRAIAVGRRPELGLARVMVRAYLDGTVPFRKGEAAPRSCPVWDAVAARVQAVLVDSERWTGGKQRLTDATRPHLPKPETKTPSRRRKLTHYRSTSRGSDHRADTYDEQRDGRHPGKEGFAGPVSVASASSSSECGLRR